MLQPKNRTLAKPSFFDTEEEISTFWKQTDSSDFANYPTIIEGEVYFRNNKTFFEWDQCFLAIKGSFLVCMQKKKEAQTVNYIDFDAYMYKIQILSPKDKLYSKKYKYSFNISSHRLDANFYLKDEDLFNRFMKNFKNYCVMTDFKENYTISDVLGSGGYGQVYLVEEKNSKIQYAAKMIPVSTEKNLKKQRIMVTNEIRILKKMNYKHIVKFYEVYEIDNNICIITEYVEGTRLFDHVVRSGKLSESESATFIKQLLLTLNYMEGEGVIHRDIKPENILFTLDKTGKIVLKLIDFGLATYHFHRDTIKKCGTAGYTAPEILLGDSYDFKADLYSCGIVMYICLTGRPAFHGTEYKELLEENKSGYIKFKEKHWAPISSQARDLCQKMVEVSPYKRSSLDLALTHRWFELMLPPDEYRELCEFNFHTGHIKIPEEIKIADVPISQYPASQFSISKSNSMEALSQSFVNSRLALGTKYTLHSFYKNKTKDDTETETMRTLTSPKMKNINMHFSRNTSILSTKTNTFVNNNMFLLHHGTTQEEHHRLNSGSYSLKFNKSLTNGTRVRLQLTIQEPTDTYDLTADDDEGSPLMDKYNHLKIQRLDFCFSQIKDLEKGGKRSRLNMEKKFSPR